MSPCRGPRLRYKLEKKLGGARKNVKKKICLPEDDLVVHTRIYVCVYT